MTLTAVLDANVLVPARIRDVLLSLAAAGLYRPVWSSPILDEMVRHLPTSVSAEASRRLQSTLAEVFPEASVTWPSGYWFDALGDVNEKDRHVLQAAAIAHAEVVVSEDQGLQREWNGGDIRPAIEIQGCAAFTAYAVDTDVVQAREALVAMVARWAPTERDPVPRLGAWMRRQGWAMTADLIEQSA